MGRRGPPPQPTERKRLLGNPGKRALPAPIIALQAVVKLPVAVAAPDGRAMVQSILDAGASSWIGTTDQLALLDLLAQGWDERTKLRAAVMGDQPEDIDIKEWLAWLVIGRKQLRDLEKQITQWLSLLGLTPSDRSRLGVAEVRVRSKLEELRLRREARGRPGS